ncbi:MAG: hypothetical protein RL091_573 [Verrucomicrobiota bacterium]
MVLKLPPKPPPALPQFTPPAFPRMHSLTSPKVFPTCTAVLGCLFALILLPTTLPGQGCIIARGGGGAGITDGSGYLNTGDWQITQSIRHFDSHRHFAGDDEQTHRSDNGTEVYNNSWFFDTTLTYAWSRRLSLFVTVPFVNHDRSSLYEHLGNNSGQRFATQASGIADVQAGASFWVLHPDHAMTWNLQVGASIKFPTGDAEAQDIFVRSSGPTLRYVDSSIQPGDGGTGFSISLSGFYSLEKWVKNLSLYGNGFYLFNPEERNEKTGFSIPDGYMVRGGLEYRFAHVQGLSASLGVRNEGVVAHDLFGGSRGFRRPGFAVAIEPGFTFSKGRFTSTLTVPIAIHRNRVTTYGAIKAGDAAFADYTINVSVAVKL